MKFHAKTGKTQLLRGKWMALTVQEISRKLLHIVALSMPLCIFYLPMAAPFILGGLFFSILLVEWIRFRSVMVEEMFRRLFGIMLRPEESRITTGATWIILSAFVLAVLFPHRPHIPFMVLTMFILGDSAAAIVGQTLGRVRIAGKTAEGSLACLGTCLILSYVVFPIMPGMEAKSLHPAVIWTGSLVVTFFELVTIKIKGWRINDNLSAPIMASLVIYLLEKIIEA